MTDIVIQKGKTYSRVLRKELETDVLVWKAITAITKAGPAVITAASHGRATGWRAAVVSAGGMRQVNAAHWPPFDSEFYIATNSGTNSVTLNDVNSASWTTYTSGGSLVYYTPVSLASCTARMMVRATADATGAPLVSLVSPTAIVLDDTLHTVTITIAATATDDYAFYSGVYDIELETAAGVVTLLDSGNVTVEDEVTRADT